MLASEHDPETQQRGIKEALSNVGKHEPEREVKLERKPLNRAIEEGGDEGQGKDGAFKKVRFASQSCDPPPKESSCKYVDWEDEGFQSEPNLKKV